MDRVAVVAYQTGPEEYGYGGIGLYSIPELSRVNDDQQCDLPDNNDKWQIISNSCFRADSGQKIPVLDIKTLFTAGLQAVADAKHPE